MRLNHQLREQLYNAGFKMSPEAKRKEVEDAIEEREQTRIQKAKESFNREIKRSLWSI